MSSAMFEFYGQRWMSWGTVIGGALVAVVLTLAGVGLLRSGEPWATLAFPVAALVAAASCGAYVRWVARPRRFEVAVERVAAEAATSVPVMRRSMVYLLAPSTALGVTAVWGLVLATRLGDLVWPWIALLVVVVPFVLQPARSLLRRPVVALTPQGIRYRGQTVDARLDWHDVVDVGHRAGPRGVLVTVAGRPGSWRAGRSYWLLPMEWMPEQGCIDVEIHGRGDAELATVLPAWIDLYRRDASRRSELGTDGSIAQAREVRDRVLTGRG